MANNEDRDLVNLIELASKQVATNAQTSKNIEELSKNVNALSSKVNEVLREVTNVSKRVDIIESTTTVLNKEAEKRIDKLEKRLFKVCIALVGLGAGIGGFFLLIYFAVIKPLMTIFAQQL